MGKKFYGILSECIKNKPDNSFYLTNEKYTSLIKMKETKCVKRKQTFRYRRLKRYDIPNIGGENKLIAPLSAEFLYYVTIDEVFNVMHDAHITVGHVERTRMIKELIRKYKNVTVESIVTYLRLFEPCPKKQKNCKKGD